MANIALFAIEKAAIEPNIVPIFDQLSSMSRPYLGQTPGPQTQLPATIIVSARVRFASVGGVYRWAAKISFLHSGRRESGEYRSAKMQF